MAEWDHWIAFTLLLILGLHMIYNGLKHEEERRRKTRLALLPDSCRHRVCHQHRCARRGRRPGVCRREYLVAAAAIGLATMTMVTIGVMLGRVLGTVVGKRAEIVGGVVLMIVGATILYEHLAV